MDLKSQVLDLFVETMKNYMYGHESLSFFSVSTRVSTYLPTLPFFGRSIGGNVNMYLGTYLG